MALELGDVLNRLYASEINFSVYAEWDNGLEVKLGDELNGYVAETVVKTAQEAAQWLDQTVRELHPQSSYAGGPGYSIPLERALIHRVK